MKFLIDFLPILLFFIAYKFAGIYVATGVAIAASLVQVGWSWWQHRRVESMPLITLAILVVFGGLTILLHDPIFVMWKPTLVNWLFAALFLGAQWWGGRTLIERMMGEAIRVPAPVWSRLNLMWVGFFLFLGAANLFIIYVGSGFYADYHALLASSGLDTVDLTQCAATFQGEVLSLCNQAKASEGIWVNFKLFGMMGLMILFVIAQAVYLSRFMTDDSMPVEAD